MNGIVPLNKDLGKTSSDYVYKLRKILQTKKIGHTGTLDPLVDGVLPICVGQSTKLVERLTSSPKEYCGEITIGRSTTTEDREGETVDSKPVLNEISIDNIRETLSSMEGEIEQIPPMFSAVKVNGKKLYEYARAGETVERPVRRINIYKFELNGEIELNEDTNEQTVPFRVRCSKGTYVRTLAVQVGEKLGYPAFMSQLTRVESAGILIENTYHLSEIEEMVKNENYEFLTSIESVLSYLPKYTLNDDEWNLVGNGVGLQLNSDKNSEVALYFEDKIKAIYKYDHSKNLWVASTMLLQNN
ncbi:tRNA pseudouridine(55) synthase TruB [Companilactobacillus metriopterae]|uniref:tRNA pseudouridine(55) synthase TruB n=1 Tax=Companilactobacillus metriopterae TaxID=1909267 RepID=UPI00100A58DE|nr:tRNA pseudouridine(55) synthase TruB [Companilactobacillus metriopterae]